MVEIKSTHPFYWNGPVQRVRVEESTRDDGLKAKAGAYKTRYTNIPTAMLSFSFQCGTSFIHYENTPIQIYWKFYNQKLAKFQIKNSNIFYISAQNIDCGYSLEPSRRGGSNEYPQSMFWAEIRKIIYTPVDPSFTI